MKPVGNGNSSGILGADVNDPRDIASDFEKLNLYREKTLSDEMTLIRQGTEVRGCDKCIKMSSAFKVILCSLLPTKIPEIKVFCLIAWASCSIAMSKSKGLRGSPCLFPRWRGKFSDLSPLVSTAAIGVLYKTPIRGAATRTFSFFKDERDVGLPEGLRKDPIFKLVIKHGQQRV